MNLEELESEKESEVPISRLIAVTEDKKEKDVKKDKKKPKSFWDKIFSINKLKKPNKVAVIYLRNNGNAEPMEVEVRNGFFNIKGKTYHENRDCMFTFSRLRTPLAIIPEWSLIPVGTKDWDDKDIREKFAEVQDHALRGIRHAELVRMGDKETKPLNTKTIILLIVGLVIAGAVIYPQLT